MSKSKFCSYLESESFLNSQPGGRPQAGRPSIFPGRNTAESRRPPGLRGRTTSTETRPNLESHGSTILFKRSDCTSFIIAFILELEVFFLLGLWIMDTLFIVVCMSRTRVGCIFWKEREMNVICEETSFITLLQDRYNKFTRRSF
ncbi:hypothetical protein BDZ45DRAFT_395901 [Acephala macrosclerotiorum]|nr:hypothetical protein BDZ45DRAFT_395901 [Acephala macrosclerotiorum]